MLEVEKTIKLVLYRALLLTYEWIHHLTGSRSGDGGLQKNTERSYVCIIGEIPGTATMNFPSQCL